MGGLSRTVWMLGLVSLLTDLSSEMIYPLLPVFLSTVLGATALELGVIEGVAEATASLLKMVSGMWTDRTKRRKPLIILGYSVSGIFRPLIGLVQSWHGVLLLRFLDRVGKGIRSAPRDVLIADVTAQKDRGAAYGLHRAMDHAGAVGGPLIASALLLIPGVGLREVFLWAAAPALLAILFLAGGVKEESRGSRSVAPTAFRPLEDWRKLGPEFKTFLGALLLFTLGNSTDAFLLMKLSNAGLSSSSIALLWSLQHLVKMGANYVGGRLSDRHERRMILASGWMVFAMVYLAFSFAESPVALVSVFLVYGLYFGLVEPSERALVADWVPESLRGTAFGWFHWVVGLGALPASLLFGWIWKVWGSSAAFTTGAVLAFVAAVVLLSVRPKQGGGAQCAS